MLMVQSRRMTQYWMCSSVHVPLFHSIHSMSISLQEMPPMSSVLGLIHFLCQKRYKQVYCLLHPREKYNMHFMGSVSYKGNKCINISSMHTYFITYWLYAYILHHILALCIYTSSHIDSMHIYIITYWLYAYILHHILAHVHVIYSALLTVQTTQRLFWFLLLHWRTAEVFVGSIHDDSIVTSCRLAMPPFDHVSIALSCRQSTVSETFLSPSPGASFDAWRVYMYRIVW